MTDASALETVNEAFHDAYDHARDRAELAAPVLVVLSDRLVLVRRGGRRELPLALPAFHALKAAAHAPVAVYAALRAAAGRPVDPAKLERLRMLLARARVERLDTLVGVEVATRVDAVLAVSASGLEMARSRAPSATELDAFARGIGPSLLLLTDDATRLQLEALHAQVERALSELDGPERATFEVVVTGAHQARARSFAMQYFQARFGEHEGVEARVTYGEGIETEEEAITLVGTRRLDRVIAGAFFGDPRRLQRDVLGDAAASCLRAMDLPPLV